MISSIIPELYDHVSPERGKVKGQDEPEYALSRPRCEIGATIKICWMKHGTTKTHVFHVSIKKNRRTSTACKCYHGRTIELIPRDEPHGQYYDLWMDLKEKAKFEGCLVVGSLWGCVRVEKWEK
jgi:hypothetical protein